MTAKRAERLFCVALVALALLLGQCSRSPETGELERLRRENEELRSKVTELERDNRRLRGQPATAEEVQSYFSQDATQGTLAGLLPGDELPQARFRFGQENRFRTWTDEGRPIFQYEWDLVGGMVIRINADGQGRLQRIAVVLTEPKSVNIPTLNGLRLGQETYNGLQKKFAESSTTDLQLWGAQGHYTVSQKVALGESRRLELVYEMPASISKAELERIGREVLERKNLAVLDAPLRDQAPFLLALEEVR